MNIALWIMQGLLALIFILAGSMKAIQFERAEATLPWVKDTSKGLVAFIGASELLGGLAIILPYATGMMPSLTPIAAMALAVVMLLAASFHVKRKEYQGAGVNVILLALVVFVAVGRF